MPFVSDLDQFLQNFDKKNPQKSASQKEVIKKTEKIFYLRDHHDDQSGINVPESSTPTHESHRF